jgi:hypothetical protein
MAPGAIEIQAAAGSAKGLDPQTTVAAGLAADSPQEAVGNATATRAYASATKTADGLAKQSIGHQQAWWNDASQQEQGQLRAIGYKPPPTNDEMHSASPVSTIFGSIVGAGKDLAGDVGQVSHDVLNAAASPLRFVQHAVRAAHVVGEIGLGEGGMSQAQIAQKSAGAGVDPIAGDNALFSSSAWSRAWRQTSNGEKSFDPAIERSIQAKTPKETFTLAKLVAQGVPQQEIVAGYHPNQRLQVQQALNTGEVQAVATQLNNAHLSVGQLAVGEKFLTDHPDLGHKISGGIDAAFDIAADPTMQGGKVLDAVKVAKWGLDASRAAEYASTDTSAYRQLLQQPQAQRWVSYVGDKISSDGWSQLERTQPKVFKVAQLASADGVTDAPSLNTWLEGNAGVNAILKGDAATLSHGAAIMPHLSVTGYQRMLAKGAFTKGVDWLDDTGKAVKAEKLATSDVEMGGDIKTNALDSITALPTDLQHIVRPLGSPFTDRIGGTFGNLLLKPATSMARVYKQLTTLTVDKPYLQLTADDAPVNLKRMLSYALPSTHVNKVVDAFIATDDIGQRFNIVKGATAQMLHAAGVYSGPNGAEIGDKLMQGVDDAFRNETYSPLGIDKMSDTVPGSGVARRMGVLENQLSDTVALPSFKEVRMAARRDHFLYGLGIVNPNMVDSFMAAWKASVLMRVGFAARVSMDEWLGNGLRNGFMGAVVARSTLSEVKRAAEKEAALADETKAMDALGPDEGRIASAVVTATSRVPSAILKQVKTTSDLASAIFGHAAYLVYKGTGGALTRAQFYDAAKLFYDNVWTGHLSDLVSSLAHAGGGYDIADNMRQLDVGGGKFVSLKLKPSAGFSDAEATQADPMYRLKWHYALGQLGHSQLARPVLENIDQPRALQVQKVLDILKSPDFEETAKKSGRYSETPDGRKVATGEVTRDDALKSWASKVVAHTNALVRSVDPEDGEVLHDIVNEMVKGHGAPSLDTLNEVGGDKLPKSVFGPELANAPGNFSKLVQTGFQSLSKIIDWLSRQPITLQAYAEGMEELRPWVEQIVGKDASDEVKNSMLSDLAWHRAGNKIKPYIHSPEIRSQFEVIHRTAMPFLFAQDQFIKRWVRTFADSPEAIRKAQLAMNGMKTSGFVHTDSNGNEFFYYPGSATVTSLLSDVLTKIGVPASLPISVPFTGEIKNIMPGLADPLTPSVGPLVAVPLKALADHFPEMQPAETSLLQEGATESWWEQVLPTTVTRLIQTYSGSSADQGEFGSMMMKAIQQAEETGHGLPPDATPAQTQAYLNRVTNWTRINFFVKAALGFTAPASPSAQFDPHNFDGKLQALLNELPYDQAITTFLKENPTASAYTVFKSQTTGDVANLASTQAAGKFLDENQAFVAAHPQAAGWLIPRTTGANAYDPSVYRQQVQNGLRTIKAPAQFLQDVEMAPAASVYIQSLDTEQKLITQAGTDSAAKANIRQSFDQWQAKFTRQNPAYASYLASGGKAEERSSTIRDLQQAMSDPTLPQGPQTEHVRLLLESFDNAENSYLATEGNYSSSSLAYQANLKAGITDWANQYIAENPDVADLWNLVLLPELGDKGVTQGLTP